MTLTSNFNLFFTIIAASITAFLGFLIFLHNRRGAANIIFICQSLVGAIWAFVNYFSITVSPEAALPWVRLVIFFAVPYVFLFFLFVQNFPNNEFIKKKWLFWGIFFWMIAMMGLAISPFVFAHVEVINGQPIPEIGSLMPFFAGALVLVFLATFVQVVRKFFKKSELRQQWIAIGSGFLIAYTLLIFFVFIRVILHGDTTFVADSPLFIIPIFIGATYAILREHLFAIKVVAAEVMTFFLLLASCIEVINAQGAFARGISLVAVAFTAIFGILLIQSVLREVQQREQLADLNKQIAEKNAQLEDLSHFKSQLLSLASHQIKSPLAAIKGFVSLIVGGSYGEVGDKVKETLGKVQHSADDLLSLINTLLDVRKVDEGKMEYKMERTDLNKMIADMVDLLKPLASVKQLEFTFAGPGHEVWINADAEKLRQVIQNLTDNAIKYTPSGFVHVELKEDTAAAPNQVGTAVVAVTDSGLGIPADLVPHLFEEFVRDERVKKEIRGTGLGLYIAAKITEAHGGKLSAESPGEGKGSTFRLTIPEIT
jgi:signal transduction histidine kinase